MSNNSEKRRELAQETLNIIQDGEYTVDGKIVDIADAVSFSREHSVLISQSEAQKLGENLLPKSGNIINEVINCSTLEAILQMGGKQITNIGVLNFASAKNPGGGFLNGALAQEESLAVASTLYDSQISCPAYYEVNREYKSMMYTDTAIWSPNVVFFRNDSGNLCQEPVKASVLTLPAVNYGQVILKGEDTDIAEQIMFQRMKIALSIFAKQESKVLILGAYGCGVFKNDPKKISAWWKELLSAYGGYFDKVVFAILGRTKTQDTIKIFQDNFKNI